MMKTWTFHPGDLDSADVKQLLAAHFEQARAISPPEGCHVLAIDQLRAPAISFWSVRESGRLLGFGALKQLDAEHGEVKSMRTAPHALRRGVGDSMLCHILDEARRRGYCRVSLETGSGPSYEPAMRLYLRHGFERCPPFADYEPTPFNIFLTRLL